MIKIVALCFMTCLSFVAANPVTGVRESVNATTVNSNYEDFEVKTTHKGARKLNEAPVDTTSSNNGMASEQSTLANKNSSSSSVSSTFPYPLQTMDVKSNKKTVELIEMIHKNTVKPIVPLVVKAGPKKKAVSGLRSRRNQGLSRWSLHFEEIEHLPVLFLLQPEMQR